MEAGLLGFYALNPDLWYVFLAASKVSPTPSFDSCGLRHVHWVGKVKFQWSGVRASNSRTLASIHPEMSSWQPPKWVLPQNISQQASGRSIVWEKWSLNDLVLGHQILGDQPPFILICLLDSLQSESHPQFWLRRPQACPLCGKSEVSMIWC